MTKIFIDAYADMLQEEATKNDLILAPSKLKINNKIINFTCYKDIDKTITDLSKDILDKKCQVIPLTMQEWLDYFTPYLKNGDDIIFFTVSQKFMSDGGEDLKAAFTKMNEEYPDRKCFLIDTNTVSRGTSEIALIASIINKKGSDIESIVKYINDKIIGTYVSAFVINDMKSVQSSPILNQIMKNFIGGSIGMKPLMCIDTQGNLRILDSIKGFKLAVSKLYDIVADNGVNIADYTFTIVNFDAKEEATKLFDMFSPQVEKNEIRNLPLSLNNAIVLGGKCVGITFHSKKQKAE